MKLVTYGDDDLGLTEAIECDPEMMRELGGPVAREDVPAIHRKRLESAAEAGWWHKIVPEPPGPAAGTIGIWEATWRGEPIHEIGWMVLPEFQGRGIASEALEMTLSLARSDSRIGHLHAFPAVTNEPSNALCAKFGFVRTGEEDFRFRGATLHCNHWELDVGATG